MVVTASNITEILFIYLEYKNFFAFPLSENLSGFSDFVSKLISVKIVILFQNLSLILHYD